MIVLVAERPSGFGFRYGSIETAVEAMRLGAYDCITKPFDREELLLRVSKELQYTALIRENRSLKQFIESNFSLENVIGTSSAMRRVYALVEKVARTDLAILITGESGTESGTGKEPIAFESRGITAVNRPGFGHIAFAVDDVAAAQNEPPQPRLAYPKCGANQTLPIEYGLPNFDLLPLSEERDFVLGGCCIGSELPKWFCK
jgi:Sigma-54 interaction domain